MSELFQPGQHLDADRLSAFMEHALPVYERESALAHLAICPDCRAVLALAMPPVEEAASPVFVAKTRVPVWRLLWSGAALATAILVTIQLVKIVRPARQPDLNAHALPIAPVGPPLAIPPIMADKPLTTPTPQSPAQPAAKPAIAGEVAGGFVGGLGATLPPKLPAETRHRSDMPGVEAEPAPPAPHIAALRPLVAQPPATPKISAGNAMGAGTAQGGPTFTLRTENRNTAAAAPRAAAQPAAPAPQSQTVQGTGASDRITTTNAISLAQVESLSSYTLPSHLTALSVATSGDRAVAIDTAHTLFFSKDGGKHWKKAKSAWPGRAMQVSLAVATVPANGRDVSQFAASSDDASSYVLQSNAPNAAISGLVTDPTGAVIPGASITVTSLATGLVRSAKADRTGHFTIDKLLPGRYQVAAISPGFASSSVTIAAPPAHQTTANLQLQIGAVAEAVTVDAASADLESSEPKVKKMKIPEPPIFTITTETGAHWSSVDGKTWKPN